MFKRVKILPLTRQNTNLGWIPARKLKSGFKMNRHIISLFFWIFCVTSFFSQLTQICGHVTSLKVNKSISGSASLNFDRSSDIAQWHHARRFNTGSDDNNVATSSISGSVFTGRCDVIILRVDFDDKISADVEIWQVILALRFWCGPIEPANVEMWDEWMNEWMCLFIS